jgi:hypothetical protein
MAAAAKRASAWLKCENRRRHGQKNNQCRVKTKAKKIMSKTKAKTGRRQNSGRRRKMTSLQAASGVKMKAVSKIRLAWREHQAKQRWQSCRQYSWRNGW